MNSASFVPFNRICSGRRDRAILSGLGGLDGIRHFAVFRVFHQQKCCAPHLMIPKDIVRRLLPGFYVLPLSASLLGLTRYSYRAKELLVCWLFFCALFAVLALMFLGAVLACYAGQYVVKWVSATNTVIPELAVRLAELPQEVMSVPRILVAGTLSLPAAPYESVNARDANSCLLIEAAHSAEEDV